MLIDTHCHLDAAEFDTDRAAVLNRAAAAGVQQIIIPAVQCSNFQQIRDLAWSWPGGRYALGIHPLYVAQADDHDLLMLEQYLRAWQGDPRLVALGEIGLDFFVPDHSTPVRRARQEAFYVHQLGLARRFGLPVLLHGRKSQDVLLKYLRRYPSIGGIAHAFNGSLQQARQFLDLGFALGMGGALTFDRALQIRRLATQLPIDALVLETDAPDMAPAWLGRDALGHPQPARNEPAEISGVADCLAALREESRDRMVGLCADNARRVLPKLG